MVTHIEGKDPVTGRFVKGNKHGGRSPYGAQVAKLRQTLLDAVTPEDMREVTLKLIEKAKEGSIAHIDTLYNRVLGKPQEADIFERIAELETVFAGLNRHGEG